MDYKKILKGIVDIINTTEKSDIGFANICTYIGENCPELKESEDERIRKDIIEYLKALDNNLIGTKIMNEWITWLEKQGEHANFRNKIQIGDKVTRNEDGVLVNLSQLKRVAKQGEQKPAWSEEDEKILVEILKIFNVENFEEYNIGENNEDALKFLKSLKDRVQPQSKQEWSEEKLMEGLDKAAKEWDVNASFSPFYMVMDGDRPTDVRQDITSHGDSFKAGVEWVINKLKAS